MNSTIQDIINDVHDQILQNPKLVKELLSITDKNSLVQYHHSLGRMIRNNYNLWNIPWTPELDSDGVDCSPYHPDQVSQTIIEEVWTLLKQNNPTVDNQSDKKLELLLRMRDAATELAQYASYAEIIGAIKHNQVAIRKWCDEVYEVNRLLKDIEESEEDTDE